MVWNLSGLLLTDGDFTKWRQAMRTHGTQSRSMLCVVETRAFEIYGHIAGWSRTLSTRWYGPIRKFDSHSRNRGLENNNYRMISWPYALSCSVTQFPPWSSHSPVCTITAVSKDHCSGRLVFHMILVSPPYRTNWGCLLADSARSAGKLLDQFAGRPSMFVLRSNCVSTPEIFGGRFGKS